MRFYSHILFCFIGFLQLLAYWLLLPKPPMASLHFLFRVPQKPLPHTGTPALPLLQVQPDLQPPYCQYLRSPVLPYPSGTVSHLRQAVRSFLLRHLHNLRYLTAAFSLPEKASLSVPSLRTSFPILLFRLIRKSTESIGDLLSGFPHALAESINLPDALIHIYYGFLHVLADIL